MPQSLRANNVRPYMLYKTKHKGFLAVREPQTVEKLFGPLWEGDSPQCGEMSRSDRGARARRAPPAGGGGESFTQARRLRVKAKLSPSGPSGHLPPRGRLFDTLRLPRIEGAFCSYMPTINSLSYFAYLSYLSLSSLLSFSLLSLLSVLSILSFLSFLSLSITSITSILCLLSIISILL